MEDFLVQPIGVIRTPYTEKYDSPRQPEVDDRIDQAQIELLPHQNFEQAAADLAGFERIWVITWFHRTSGWKPKILTPRDRTKHGVFATRSPHRPNPIGLSCVRLLDVKGLVVSVQGTDLLDGTPVLDIKPYLPYADAFPFAQEGWTAGLGSPLYDVAIEDSIAAKAPAVAAHAKRVLSADPLPHPYRRTKLRDDGTYELAMKHWRCYYVILDDVVRITDIVLHP